MLRFIAIGDPHFKINNTCHSDEFTVKIISYIEKNINDIDFIVVLGDVHDKHQYIHSHILGSVSKFINDLSKYKPTYVLVGNHDRINNSEFLTNTHPFVDMIDKDNIYIAYKVLDVNIKGYRCLFTPYVPNGRFMEALNTVENPLESSIIFAHQEFRDVPMKAIKSTTGDIWDVDNPWVISGHIHDYWYNGINIIYPGTPMQHSFGDKNDKTISHYTLYEEKIKKNLHKLEEKRIDLELKKREIIRIPYNKIEHFKVNKNRYQKLIIIGTVGQIKSIKKLPYYNELKDVVTIDFDYIEDEDNIEEIMNKDENLLINNNHNYLYYLEKKAKESKEKLEVFYEIFK